MDTKASSYAYINMYICLHPRVCVCCLYVCMCARARDRDRERERESERETQRERERERVRERGIRMHARDSKREVAWGGVASM